MRPLYTFLLAFAVAVLAVLLYFVMITNQTETTVTQSTEGGVLINTVTEYYPSGQIRLKREMDRDMNPRGMEEAYYENGVLKHRIYFIGNMPWSVSEGHKPDGTPLDLGTLFFGTGTYKEYDGNGNLHKTGAMKDSKCDSLWIFYYPDGTKQKEVMWVSGVQEGMSKVYFKSGNLFRETPYRNNLREGEAREYYDKKGLLRQTRIYVNGIENGPVKHYNEMGYLESLSKMRNGKFVDTMFRYNAYGDLIDMKVMPRSNSSGS